MACRRQGALGLVAALTIALVLALAEGQLYTGIVTTGTVGNKNVDAKLQEVLGECSKSDECPHPKLCVRHSCVCPVIYQGNENCTALQKASDKKARGWCVMPVTSKRFGDYAKGKHWRIVRAGKKADRKAYYNPNKIPFDKMFFTDREGWQFREDLRNHFATCAVVGNSDRLKSRPEDKLLGAEIDAHTAVIRFNGAPTKKYKKFVGSRTTLRVQNIAYCGHHEADEFCIHYSRENGGHHNCEQKQWAKCKQINLSKHTTEYIWDYWMACKTPPGKKDPAKRKAKLSSGFFGILLAMHLCGEVDIYGFDQSDKHYYTKKNKSFMSGKRNQFYNRHKWVWEGKCLGFLRKGIYGNVTVHR